MSVIGSCGHNLSKEEGLGISMAIRDYAKDGSRAISHISVCNECAKLNKELELKTEKEQNDWLKISEEIDLVQQTSIEFAEWIRDNMYVKYWGSDEPNNHKWYKSYTAPDRDYFTTKELYGKFEDEKMAK